MKFSIKKINEMPIGTVLISRMILNVKVAPEHWRQHCESSTSRGYKSQGTRANDAEVSVYDFHQMAIPETL